MCKLNFLDVFSVYVCQHKHTYVSEKYRTVEEKSYNQWPTLSEGS